MHAPEPPRDDVADSTVREPGRADATRFGGIAPIFRVRDLARSIAYYVDALDFAVDWTHPGGIASVTRDRCTIFLSEDEQGEPVTWAWIGVGDARRVHEELASRGARIRQAPTNFEWSLELQVEDLDRNVLRIGSSPREGAPIGPWLDMHGDRWHHVEGGGWRRESWRSVIVCDALRQRRLLRFLHKDNTIPTVVEPYLYGINSAGNVALSAWLVSGQTHGDGPPFWRTYLEADLRDLELLEREFVADRPGFNPDDPRFLEIQCRVAPPP